MIPEIRINNIGVGNVGIGDVSVDDVQRIGVRSPQTIRVADNRIWVVNPPNVHQMEPPVVVQVGTPVVNIAGCVEVHKENVKSNNRNKQLVDNDPKGNTVLCDSGAPSFRWDRKDGSAGGGGVDGVTDRRPHQTGRSKGRRTITGPTRTAASPSSNHPIGQRAGGELGCPTLTL